MVGQEFRGQVMVFRWTFGIGRSACGRLKAEREGLYPHRSAASRADFFQFPQLVPGCRRTHGRVSLRHHSLSTICAAQAQKDPAVSFKFCGTAVKI